MRVNAVSKLDKFYVDPTPLRDTNLMAKSVSWSEQQICKGPRGGNLWGIQRESKIFLKPQISSFSELEIWQSILHYLTPQIWWRVQIFHLLISFFGHFSKWSVGVSIHVRATISMRFDALRLVARTTSEAWHPFLQMASGCEVYAVCSCTSFAMHCAAQIPVWCFMWDLISYLFSWFLLDVMWNHLWDVLVIMIRHVLFEIPLSSCWWDTHDVAMYVCIEIHFMPCWQDVHYHHAWVVSYW